MPLRFDRGGSSSSDQVLIEPQDLSSVSADDNALYLHDGTSEITLADGSTTSQVSYYRWDESASGWRQLGQDSDTVDGYHADQLAKVNGETFTAPVRVDTDTQDALIELLTAVGSQYTPATHLGGDQDNGIRAQYEPDANAGQIGAVDSGTFTPLLSIDQAGSQTTMNRAREINIGSFDADEYESVFRVHRNGNLIGYIDQSASDMRFKAWSSSASALLINHNNNGLAVTPNDRVSFQENDVGDMPKYSDDTAPSADTLFYDTTDGQLEYNDPSGTNHVLG